jgi:hypothetical protein
MSDERVTYNGFYRQTWRQVGWLGNTGGLYGMTATDAELRQNTAWISPLWQLIDDEPMIQPVAAVRYGPGQAVEVFQGTGVNQLLASGMWTALAR